MHISWDGKHFPTSNRLWQWSCEPATTKWPAKNFVWCLSTLDPLSNQNPQQWPSQMASHYSHQCSLNKADDCNPWFLVACPVLMGALGILSPKLRMGAIGTQRQGSLSEVMMGSIPTILCDYDWMPRVWKRCFFFIYLLVFVNKHVRKHWKETTLQTWDKWIFWNRNICQTWRQSTENRSLYILLLFYHHFYSYETGFCCMNYCRI